MVPSGYLRLDIDANYITWDERFGLRREGESLVEEVEPLGWNFSRDALGSDQLLLAALNEARLQAALDDAGYRMHLGSTHHLFAAHVRRVPLGFRLGIFRWLTVGASLPMVQRKFDSELIYSPDGANAGVAPLPTVSRAFLSQYEAALAFARDAVASRCAAGAGTPECLSGQATIQRGDALYGTLSGLLTELSFFPLEGSEAGRVLAGLVEDVRGGLSEIGATDFTEPLPLGTPMNQSGFDSRIGAAVSGGAGLPLRGVESLWEPGDLEVSAAIRILNSLPGSAVGPPPGQPADSLADPGEESGGRLGFQLGVEGTLRLATGTPQDTLRHLLDMDVPEGQMDIEARAFGSVRWAGWVGLAFDARYGIASPASVQRRLVEPDAGFALLTPLEPVRWRPGNYFEYAIAPHLLLMPQLSIGVLYRSHVRQADTYQGSDRDLTPLTLETEATVRSLGVDVRYSSFRGGGFPLEVWFGWESARNGTGGQTPKTGRVRFGASLFRRMWGGG